MDAREDRTADILTRAECFPRTRAGMARPEVEWTTTLSNDAAVTQWPAEGRSVLVPGLHHPEDDPRLDWWKQGNT